MTKSKQVYQLYHDKDKRLLKVSQCNKIFYNDPAIFLQFRNQSEDFVYYYNPNYYFSSSRKMLVQKARHLKEEWIKELESKLYLYKNIKI